VCGTRRRQEIFYFLSIARGSLNELDTQVPIAVMLRYIAEDHPLHDLLDRVGKLLSGFSKKLKRIWQRNDSNHAFAICHSLLADHHSPKALPRLASDHSPLPGKGIMLTAGACVEEALHHHAERHSSNVSMPLLVSHVGFEEPLGDGSRWGVKCYAALFHFPQRNSC
jgi:hypothetical protein